LIDPSVDDPLIRYHVLGTMFLQGEGQRLSEEALWPDLIPILAGWEDDYQKLVDLDTRTRAQYGGEPEPLQAAEMYARLTASYQQAEAKYQMALQAGADVSTMAPPVPPLPPNFLPRQPELRVYLTWQSIFARKGQVDPTTQTQLSALDQLLLVKAPERRVGVEELKGIVDSYLRFRAVFEAYRLMSPPTVAPGSNPTPGGPPPGPPPGMAAPGPAATPNTPVPPPVPVQGA
jgi:hypothetical protein